MTGALVRSAAPDKSSHVSIDRIISDTCAFISDKFHPEKGFSLASDAGLKMSRSSCAPVSFRSRTLSVTTPGLADIAATSLTLNALS